MLELLRELKSGKINLPEVQNIEKYNSSITDIKKFEANVLLNFANRMEYKTNIMAYKIVQKIVNNGEAIRKLSTLKSKIDSKSREPVYIKLMQINGLIDDLSEVFFIKPLMTAKKLAKFETASGFSFLRKVSSRIKSTSKVITYH
jgi:hypothetical protein